jgi:Tfp pilus assembly protein PilX
VLPDLVPERTVTQKSASFSTGRHRAPRQGASSQSGAALIFVLAMLVLLLTVVLAFFSRATLNSQIASSSAKNTKGLLLTQTAEAYLLDDFQREIAAGSTTLSPTNLTIQIRRPNTLTITNGVGMTNTYAPSMVPQRNTNGLTTSGTNIVNIVKVSRGGQAFFTNGPGYTANGPARASTNSTTTPSANGRSLTTTSWNKPMLMTASEAAAFVPPNWIYIDRQGSNPTSFSSTLVSSVTNNMSYVIGRYAYVVYDVGGLIDINVVGNQLDSTNNSRRGRLNQVSLTNGIPGITDFSSLVTWRSSLSSTNTNSTSGGGGLFDPKRTFIDVPTGEQAFVNRQDLITYASNNTISTNSLPFLTTFSRDLNAPSYEPNSARPMLPASPDPNLMNPGLLTNRFAAVTTLNRPEGAITVRSGTPVMPRRFPLSKLSLFEQASPDPAAMSYYFGLTKVDSQTWRYTATTSDGRIARLSEVAALGREPNFFEILQAVITTGSLGKTSGADTYTSDTARDGLQNLQVIQIGANIIDQWDVNDIPTCIQFPSGSSGLYLSVYGIENLPYLSQIGIAGWRPTDNKNLFQVWALFDVWNPHQNAQTPPSGIDQFRILPVSGRRTASIYYTIYCATNTPTLLNLANQVKIFSANKPSFGGTVVQNTAQNLTTLNPSRTLVFSSTNDYSTNTNLGTNPASSTDTPGLLLHEATLPPAIPARGSRDPAVQVTLYSVMDIVAPLNPVIPTGLAMSSNSMGERVYPPGTTFPALNTNCWATNVGSDSNITVSDKYGAKAPNAFRLLSCAPSDGYAFDLQARLTSGSWITYQRIEGLYQQLDIVCSPVSSAGETVSTNYTSDILRNTDSSMPDAAQTNEFYKWRSRGASSGMIKTDPRTMRFGLSSWSQGRPASASTYSPQNDNLGLSIRMSTNVFLPSSSTSVFGVYGTNFCVPLGGYSAGYWAGPSPRLVGGFEMVAVAGVSRPPLFGLVSNNPDRLDNTNPARYPDPDGVIRPGDGYFGALPTVPGRIADRPLLLNRPFRSVGELGYVFRDMPWKTLDFSTRRSADLGLLDAFSLSETDGDPPLTAGQINLNTRQTAALAAVLQNSYRELPGVSASVPFSQLTTNQANTIAAAIVAESTARPFADKGDLVTRVLNSGNTNDPLAADSLKVAREAAVRALAEIGTTRTWNFMIDLVAQTGRFTAASGSGSAFMVQGEERVWIHVAIDRITGEVLEIRREVVNE